MSHKEFKPPRQAGAHQPEGQAASTDAGCGDILALRAVRKPGKGELNLGEAVKTVIEQGLAYEEWQELGAPPGIFEVWVEADNVLTLQPGETTSLKSVLCELPSLENVVVQVVRRADEIADTVVLLNRKLNFVPAAGVKFVEEHPNEQAVMLKMKQGGEGQLNMWLGFGQIDSLIDLEQKPEEENSPKPRRLGAYAMALLDLFTMPPAWGLSLAVVVICFGVQIVRPVRQVDPATRINPATAAQARYDISRPAGVASSSPRESTSDAPPEKEADVATSRVVSSARAGDAKTGAGDAKTGAGKRPIAATHDMHHHGRHLPAPAKNSASNNEERAAAVAAPAPPHEEKAQEPSAREKERLRRLGEVQTLFLRLENGSRLEAADARALLEFVGAALKTVGISVVINEAEKHNSDGTMSVRFDPDENCFGAIFAVMQDSEENTLWQAHVHCRALPHGDGHVAMLRDASARLVGKLSEVSKLSLQTGAEIEEESVRAR